MFKKGSYLSLKLPDLGALKLLQNLVKGEFNCLQPDFT